MFNNIGKKIKVLAWVFFFLFSLGDIAAGIILLAEDDDLLFPALPIMLAGPLFAWIGSWLLYGFGELIDKAADIERNTRGARPAPAAPFNPPAFGAPYAPQAPQAPQAPAAPYAPQAPAEPFRQEAPAAPAAPTAPAAPAQDPEFAQKLAKLQSLCQQGLITDEEYDIALAKLRGGQQ